MPQSMRIFTRLKQPLHWMVLVVSQMFPNNHNKELLFNPLPSQIEGHRAVYSWRKKKSVNKVAQASTVTLSSLSLSLWGGGGRTIDLKSLELKTALEMNPILSLSR